MKIVTKKTKEDIEYPIGNDIKKATLLVKTYLKAFNKLKYPKDITINLWCRGSSGAILATIFAYISKYECKIVHVKKEGETCHMKPVPEMDNSIHVVIDDFVVSGDTVKVIIERMDYLNREYNWFKIKKDVIMVLNSNKFSDQFEHIIC